MLKILVPVDGSNSCKRAINHIVMLKKNHDEPPMDLHLLNVQPALSHDIAMFIDEKIIENFHREQGIKALQEAREILDAEGIPYKTHVVIGDAAEMIAEYSSEHNIDKIIMGTRGLGPVGNLLMGSVALKTMHLVSVPVTLVK